MQIKSLLVAGVTALALTFALAGSAFAGEVTGNGKATGAPAHSNSICSFSGQNDGEPPAGRKAEHVQNWGQISKADRDALALEGLHPGDACNGNSGLLSGN